MLGMLLGLVVPIGQVSAGAAPFPAKAIRIVVGVPPGGNLDTNTRAVAERMAADLGQPIVVENRPAASALIATQLVAKASPDGYTLLAMSNTFTAVPATVKNPGWMLRDFAGVGMYTRVPMVLMVATASPLRTVQDLIAQAKRRPGAISAGSAGTGSAADITTTLLSVASEIKLLKIPYKGGGHAVTDLIGGRIDILFEPMSTSLPQILGGRARGIGLTGKARSPLLPDVPTFSESGLKEFHYEVFNGFLVPAGTPKEAIGRLHSALQRALADPGLRENLLRNGVEVPIDDTPEAFWLFVQGEVARHVKLANEGYLKVE